MAFICFLVAHVHKALVSRADFHILLTNSGTYLENWVGDETVTINYFGIIFFNTIQVYDFIVFMLSLFIAHE